MRKFLAAMALCTTLIGIFAPVVFSVSFSGVTPKVNVQKNVAYAGDDFIETRFQPQLTVERTTGQNGYYTIQGSIRYHATGIASIIPDGTPLNVGTKFTDAFANGVVSGLLYQAMGGALGAIGQEAILFDPELRVRKIGSTTYIYEDNVTVPPPGLKDNEYGIINKSIALPAGDYEAWFLQNNPVSSDLLSSKITFTIDQNGNVTKEKMVGNSANQNSAIKFAIDIPNIEIDTTKPNEAKISGKLKYTDSENPTSTANAPVNISYRISDPTDTGPKAAGKILFTKDISASGKINTVIPYEFTVSNLDVGKKYEIIIIENELTSSEGKPLATSYVPFTAGTPVDNAAVQQQIQQENADAAQQQLENITGEGADSSDAGFKCANWYNFRCQITIILVDLLTFTPNFIAVVIGIASDFMLKISISPSTYGLPGSGIESGIRDAWKIVRDFSNILFIFSLFVSAFMLILNKTDINGKSFDPKKTVVRVIIMALLVNFSLLFCRIIIQTADLFSNILYNKIGTTDYSKSGNTTVKSVGALYETLKIKSVSLPLIDQSDPQNLFTNAGITQDMPGSFTAYLMVGFLIFFVLLIIIWTFASMLFVFLGRILGLWIGMILSPIAFVSWSIPFIENDDLIGFNNWLKNFVQLAFMTPVYLFFIYITVTILNIEGFSKLTNTGNDVQSGGWIFNVIKIALTVLIPLLLSCFLLIQGKKIAFKMSGKIGEMVGKVSGWATTAALGAATGGTAMLARQSLGRAGSALANANRGNNSMLGKGMRNMGDKLGAASFDVRKNERAMKGFGKFTEMSGEKIDLGTRGLREGGFAAEGTLSEQYRKRQERIAKEREEKLKKEAADALLNAQAKDAQELRENQAKLEAAQKAKEAEDAKITMEAENQGPEAFIEKKEKEKEALQNQNIQLNVEKLTVESEKTTLNTEKADIENDLNNLETEKTVIEKDIQQLEAAAAVETDPDKKANIEAAVNFQKEDLAKKTTEIDNKKVELQNKNIQIQDRDKTIAEKDKEIKKNDEEIKKADTYQNNLTGITSVRDARQKKTDLELEATHSQEKAAMDKNKTDMDEKKTKADEAQRELNALNKKLENEKDKNSAKALEIKADIAKQTTERDNKDNDYKTAKTEFEKHKKAYSDAYGDKIKALADFEKEALSSYEKDHEVQIRRATAVNGIIDAQKKVNASQNNLDNLNYQFQQKFAEDLEKKAAAYQQVFGRMTEHVATVTGGLVGGEALNNAATNAATSVRRNVTGR